MQGCILRLYIPQRSLRFIGDNRKFIGDLLGIIGNLVLFAELWLLAAAEGLVSLIPDMPLIFIDSDDDAAQPWAYPRPDDARGLR